MVLITPANRLLTNASGETTVGQTTMNNIATAVWSVLTSALSVSGSIGAKLAGWVVGQVQSYAAGKSPAEALASYDPPTRAEAAADRDAVAAVVTAVKSVVDTNLDAKVSSRVSAGPGGVLRRIYVRDVAGSALGGVQVWLTADAAGDSVLGGSFTTDDAGSVLVMVDVGATYYVWCDSSAADFVNPMEWTVA
jgi:methenyltetrahydromethanopterin cyclohydrolase